ncbi:hypothetical protein RYX36_027063, partial [Vicia faba]
KLFDIHLPDDFDHEPTECELWVFREFLSLRTMEDDMVEMRFDTSINVIVAFDLAERKLLEMSMPMPGGFDIDPKFCD